MWNREKYIAHMTHQDVGRELFCELFGLMAQVDDEWTRQGATPQELDLSAFGWDVIPHAWVGNTGALTNREPTILEDTSEYTLSIDTMGRKQKLIKSSATLPLPLEYPVKSVDDWLQVKSWYTF